MDLQSKIDDISINDSIGIETGNIGLPMDIHKNMTINWWRGLQRDHVVPSIIAGNNKELRLIVDRIENLQIVHKHCHKQKSDSLDS